MKLELLFGEEKMSHNFSAPVSKSFLQSCISFATAFIFVYSIYCLIDTVINSGLSIWQGNSIWSHSIIDPTVTALGLGAFLLGIFTNRRKAAFLGILVFLSSLFVFRLWIWILPLNKLWKFDPILIPFFFPLHEALVGLVIGAIIGWIQGGRIKSGWCGLAGAIGMTTGFLIMDIAGKNILSYSSILDVNRLVVGSIWYYLYIIFPAMIQGITLGIFIGLTEIDEGVNLTWFRKTRQAG